MPSEGGTFPGLTQTQINALIQAYAAPISHAHAAADINSGVLDNARVNWAAPGVIGGTTPAAISGTTGTFTGKISVIASVSGTGAVNIEASNSSGNSIALGTNNQNYLLAGGTRALGWGAFEIAIAGNRSITFSSGGNAQDTRDTGIRRSAAGIIELNTAVAGTLAELLASKGSFISSTAGSLSSAVTGFTLGRNDSGTPAAGFGVDAKFTLKSSTTIDRVSGYFRSLWNVPTDAAAIADMALIAVYNAGGTVTEREGFRVRGGATEVMTAVNGATPVARAAHIADPTGGVVTDAEARAAINAILVVLENFGNVLAS